MAYSETFLKNSEIFKNLFVLSFESFVWIIIQTVTQ